LCNPNNPTGELLNHSDIKNVLDAVRASDAFVVVDEALIEDEKTSVIPMLIANSRLIVCRTFSKTHGLAGARIGYIVATKQIIDKLRTVGSPFLVNGAAQEFALRALDDRAHVFQTQKYLETQRQTLRCAFYSLGIKFTQTQAINMILDLSNLGFTTSAQIVGALGKLGVAVTAADAFGYDATCALIRISIATKKENSHFLRVLRKFVGKRKIGLQNSSRREV